MSKGLLMAVGGLVTDHNFRDAVFADFNVTMNRFGITDDEIVSRLSKFVNGPDRENVRHMLEQLEPYICGANLDNC